MKQAQCQIMISWADIIQKCPILKHECKKPFLGGTHTRNICMFGIGERVKTTTCTTTHNNININNSFNEADILLQEYQKPRGPRQ